MRLRCLTYLEAARLPRGAVAPRFSPSGEVLGYEQGGQTFLWHCGQEQVVGCFEGEGSTWSPDGGRLAFQREGDVYVAQPDGARPHPVGRGFGAVWAAAENRLYWTAHTADGLCVQRTAADRPAAVQTVLGAGVGDWALSPDGRWIVYFHARPNSEVLADLPDGVVQVGRFLPSFELCALEAATGRQVSAGVLPAGSSPSGLSWSPDAAAVVYTVTLNDSWSGPEPLDRHLYVWRVPEGEPRQLDLGETVGVACAAWGPDSRRLAFLANPWGRYTTDPFGWVTVFDLAANAVLGQNPGAPGTTTPKWSPDGRTLYCRTVCGVEQPYVAFSADGECRGRLTPEGHFCSAAALSPDGVWLAVSARTFSGLNEIWLCPTSPGKGRRVTSTSDELAGLDLARVGAHRWTTPGGPHLEGVVVGPVPADDLSAPLLVWLAGGPERGFEICELEANNGFLIHAIAQQGYCVFIPSHRRTGKVGLEHLVDQWRPQGALRDIVAGVKSLRERLQHRGPVVVFGQSDGGDMACELLASYPGLFEAAVVSGITPDLGQTYGMEATSNPILHHTFGGPPWERPVEYAEASPITRARRISAPLLILMGSQDAACPVVDSYYTALREAGREVTYLRFERQGHWPEEPEQQARYLETAIRWLDRRLKRAPNGSQP